MFKPRTSPYTFQGMGEPGVDLLVQAGRSAGLPTVTEISDASQMELLSGPAQYANSWRTGAQDRRRLRAALAAYIGGNEQVTPAIRSGASCYIPSKTCPVTSIGGKDSVKGNRQGSRFRVQSPAAATKIAK